jgi:drug/metabolite transporter (DMT)-like permease
MESWIKKIDLKVVSSFAAVYIIWGTTYLAIKIGLEGMPPFIMVSIRYLIAGVALLSICLIKREKLFNPMFTRNMLLGAFMLTLGQGVLFWAEQYLSSGLTAVFISTLPICYILIDKKNWKNYFHSKLTLISIAMGLIGIIVLFKDQTGTAAGGTSSAKMSIIASLVVLGSCLCWAAGSLYYKYKIPEGSLFCDVGWQLLGGAIACFFVSLFTDHITTFNFSGVPFKTWGAILYLAIAGSVIAFTASYYLLSVRPPAIVGTYAYVNPIIAVLLGWAVADEMITLSQVIGIAVILVAAYLSNKVKLKS